MSGARWRYDGEGLEEAQQSRETPRREWQRHVIAFGWIVVVRLTSVTRTGVRSVTANVSWARRTVTE